MTNVPDKKDAPWYLIICLRNNLFAHTAIGTDIVYNYKNR